MVFTTPSVPLVGDRNPQGRDDVTALRCSEPLRYKDGGPKRSRQVVRAGTAWGIAVYGLQLIVYSLQLIF